MSLGETVCVMVLDNLCEGVQSLIYPVVNPLYSRRVEDLWRGGPRRVASAIRLLGQGGVRRGPRRTYAVIIRLRNESCTEDLAFLVMPLFSSFSPPNVSSWPGRSSYVLLPTGAVSGHRAYLV